MELVTLVALMY